MISTTYDFGYDFGYVIRFDINNFRYHSSLISEFSMLSLLISCYLHDGMALLAAATRLLLHLLLPPHRMQSADA